MMSRQSTWQWLAVLGSCVGVVAAGTVYTNATTRRTIRESQEAQTRAAEQSRAFVCALIAAQDDVANDPENPPVTTRQKRAALAWHSFRVRYQC